MLQKVLDVLHGHPVIQTDEQSRARTSIEQAAQAIAAAIAAPAALNTLTAGPSAQTPPRDSEAPISRTTVQKMIDDQITPLRDQVRRLERELQAAGAGGK